MSNAEQTAHGRLERLLGSIDAQAIKHGLDGLPAEWLNDASSEGWAASRRLEEALLCLRTAFTMGQDGSAWPVMRLLVPLTKAQGGPLLAGMQVPYAAPVRLCKQASALTLVHAEVPLPASHAACCPLSKLQCCPVSCCPPPLSSLKPRLQLSICLTDLQIHSLPLSPASLRRSSLQLAPSCRTACAPCRPRMQASCACSGRSQAAGTAPMSHQGCRLPCSQPSWQGSPCTSGWTTSCRHIASCATCSRTAARASWRLQNAACATRCADFQHLQGSCLSDPCLRLRAGPS